MLVNRSLQEEIRDLLSKDQKQHLDLKERPDTGVYVKDLSSFVAKSVKEIEHVMNIGNQNRAVGYVTLEILECSLSLSFQSYRHE